MNKGGWRLGALLAVCGGAHGAPLPVPLYLMTMPPHVIEEPGQRGMVGDVVLEAMRRAGLAPQVLVEPNPRAMAAVKQGKNVYIAALSRIAEREPQYTWVAPIMPIDRAFITTGMAVDSYAQARRSFKHIAVSRDTANYQILLAEGFAPEQLVPLNAGESAPRMLLAGRVDAWYNLVPESMTLLHRIGAPKVVIGKRLSPTDLYLACSLDCAPDQVARLRASLAAMRQDGSLARLIRHYAGQPGYSQD